MLPSPAKRASTMNPRPEWVVSVRMTGTSTETYPADRCATAPHGALFLQNPRRRLLPREGELTPTGGPGAIRSALPPMNRRPPRLPDCDPKHLDAFAVVWTREAGLMVSRMFEINGETEAMRLPIEVRHEAAFELAKLMLWLEDLMIEKKTATVPIDQIAREAEAQSMTSPGGVERIDNTARIMADRIWKPLCTKWWERFPAISKAPKTTIVTGVPSSSPGVKKQHSPVFSKPALGRYRWNSACVRAWRLKHLCIRTRGPVANFQACPHRSSARPEFRRSGERSSCIISPLGRTSPNSRFVVRQARPRSADAIIGGSCLHRLRVYSAA
jgi:hypothetical protein